MTAGKNDGKTMPAQGEELKDSDLEAVAGGLSASGTGNIKVPAIKVEIEGVTEKALFDEADALFGKR